MTTGMKKCNHYQKLLCEYVDSELSEDLHDDFKSHIESCETCWKMFRTYNITVTLSKKTRDIHVVSTEQVERLCTIISSRMCVKK
jgi:anti-sigma factor RsiW